jgi:MFS transporter, UMF1 family
MDAQVDLKSYKRGWWAWALYDVGNSAFWVVVATAVFPVYYQELFIQSQTVPGQVLTEELRRELATKGGSRLGYTAAVAMLIVAALGPILGVISDRMAAKKKFLACFAGLGVVSTGLMVLLGRGDVFLASVLYTVSTVGVAGSMVFYDALLPSVAREEDLDRVSSFGFAAGYLGSVLLFILNVVVISKPAWFGLTGGDQAVRISFFSVALWWAIFTIPLLRRVKEPAARASEEAGGNPVFQGFAQLGRTFRKLGQYKQLLMFLVAFWIYGDGIGTIIKMATPFGKSLGVPEQQMMLALIATQIVGVPFALAFGALAKRIGAKTGIMIGLGVYAGICGFAAFMKESWHFWALAIAVGMVQGGTQALSRSIFASMIPKNQSGEFFGFFSTMEKFAGIAGPLLLGLIWAEGGDPRKGIVALAGFFIVGMVLLARVDVDEGRRRAAAASAPLGTGEAA